MLRVQLSPRTVGRVRFGYAPMAEVASSLRVLQSAQPPRVMRTWRREALARLTRAELEVLTAVVPAPPNHQAPHFLFSQSTAVPGSIESQLDELSATPASDLAREIRRVWRPGRGTAATAKLLAAHDLGGRLAAAVSHYWEVALAPYWDRMTAVINADVEHRSAAMGRTGVVDVINDLHPTLRIDGDHLRVDKPYADADISDTDLLLVPSVFVWPRLAVIHDGDRRFDIYYGAHGVGRVWDGEGSASSRLTLADLLGSGRAGVLLRLDVAKSTTGLAAESGTSPGTVSEHLAVLRRARLVTSRRVGRTVLYERTTLAESLIDRS